MSSKIETFTKMPLLPVAWGEVFDKLSILEIKMERISDPAKLQNVERERAEIAAVVGDLKRFPPALHALRVQLRAINAQLWDVEDGKRQAEREQRFDAHFVALARQVYVGNDQRADIKRQINALLGSALVEEKSYAAY